MDHGGHGGVRRLRTYAVNLADAHPAHLPEDVHIAAEGARKAIELAAPVLGVDPHRCFAVPVDMPPVEVPRADQVAPVGA